MPISFEDLTEVPLTHKFSFSDFIVNDLQLSLCGTSLPGAAANEGICKFYLRGHCAKGAGCQYKHTIPSDAAQIKMEKTVVCKHWLRGLCKKGDLCEFLYVFALIHRNSPHLTFFSHEYNLKKMPECWFYAKYGECSNPECMYLHIDPASKMKECAWYARGFCKHGQ
jgi:cleavage and polyadenylation specificity factor subunit 4